MITRVQTTLANASERVRRLFESGASMNDLAMHQEVQGVFILGDATAAGCNRDRYRRWGVESVHSAAGGPAIAVKAGAPLVVETIRVSGASATEVRISRILDGVAPPAVPVLRDGTWLEGPVTAADPGPALFLINAAAAVAGVTFARGRQPANNWFEYSWPIHLPADAVLWIECPASAATHEFALYGRMF